MKKISLKLEFSLGGKDRTPSVSFIGIGDYGVPFTSHVDEPGTMRGDAFDAFSNAAHLFCKKLKDEGELS